MISLADLFHDAAMFLALEPEDAGAVIFEAAQQMRAPTASETGWPLFLKPSLPFPTQGAGDPNWPGSAEGAVTYALAEAVDWLRREGLIMSGIVGTQAGPAKLVFTRRGLQLRTRADIEQYREASALPFSLVHASLVEKVIPQFLRGDRGGAVSSAFRAVEIAVRSAAGYDRAKHGMAMMREAFKKHLGPLTDVELPEGEQEAEMALFSGSIGHGRNPISHRDIDMTPVEAARLILLASHLLSIVEKRIAARK